MITKLRLGLREHRLFSRRVFIPLAALALSMGVANTANAAPSAGTSPVLPTQALGTYAITVVAHAARTAAVPAFACGWTPANNSNVSSAGFTADGVNIRTGGSTTCAIRGEGFTGQRVTVRCEGPEESDNHFWFYLTDKTTGITGWVRNDFVGFSQPMGIKNC